MKKITTRIVLLFVLILPAYLTFFANNHQIKSVPVSNLKDQLSNAQLSFFGRLNSYSGSIIRIGTTDLPSKTSANLSTGDTVAIANSGITTSSLYTVRDIGDTSVIELASSVGTTTALVNNFSYVVATRSAIHTISFIPQAAVNGEIWQFLIKATNRTGELFNDGMPDQNGFDLGSTLPSGPSFGLGTRLQAADVTCPFGATASVGTTTMISDAIGVGYTGSYNIIQCTLAAGTSNSGIATSMVVGRDLSVGSQLINPSPSLNHVIGQATGNADTYTYAVRQLDSNGNVLDITFGKLAVTENVRVTAIVDPTITFTIGTSNTSAIGTTRCGTPIGNGAVDSTAASVVFGSLILGTYNNLAQSFSCTTNSLNGYVIQVFENRPLTMLGLSTTIPNTNCNGTCTSTSATAWTTFNNSGFGYSLEVGTTSTGAVLGITTAGYYKPFGVGYSNAQPIMSRTNTPANTDSAYICYRTVASTTQQAGTYENSISFIATATF